MAQLAQEPGTACAKELSLIEKKSIAGYQNPDLVIVFQVFFSGA